MVVCAKDYMCTHSCNTKTIQTSVSIIHHVQVMCGVRSSWVHLSPACWYRTASQTQTSAVPPSASLRRPWWCSDFPLRSDPGPSLNCAKIERASVLFACEGRRRRGFALASSWDAAVHGNATPWWIMYDTMETEHKQLWQCTCKIVWPQTSGC